MYAWKLVPTKVPTKLKVPADDVAPERRHLDDFSEFLSGLRSKCDVTGVTGVTALLHAGFGVTDAAVTGVTDVTARAVYGLKKLGHLAPGGTQRRTQMLGGHRVAAAGWLMLFSPKQWRRLLASLARNALSGHDVYGWFWRNLARNHECPLPCVLACVPRVAYRLGSPIGRKVPASRAYISVTECCAAPYAHQGETIPNLVKPLELTSANGLLTVSNCFWCNSISTTVARAHHTG